MNSDSLTLNPLLQDWTGAYGLPPFATLHAAHFLPAFEVALPAHLAELDAIANKPEPATFANTLQAFDESGRLATRIELLFHNLTAKPGLRVRLSGPAGNPQGIGAAIQLKFHGHAGPLRELHSGSGYWSQDGVVQVMATPDPPVEIEVRWPGGKRTTTAIPANARELSIDMAGHLTNIR